MKKLLRTPKGNGQWMLNGSGKMRFMMCTMAEQMGGAGGGEQEVGQVLMPEPYREAGAAAIPYTNAYK